MEQEIKKLLESLLIKLDGIEDRLKKVEAVSHNQVIIDMNKIFNPWTPSELNKTRAIC